MTELLRLEKVMWGCPEGVKTLKLLALAYEKPEALKAPESYATCTLLQRYVLTTAMDDWPCPTAR